MVQNIESTDGRGHSWAESLIAKRKFYFLTNRVSSKTNLESRHPARAYKLCPGGNRCKWPTAVPRAYCGPRSQHPPSAILGGRQACAWCWDTRNLIWRMTTPRPHHSKHAPVNSLILGYSKCWHLCLSGIHLCVEFTCVLSELLGFQFNFILRVQASIAGTLPPNF